MGFFSSGNASENYQAAYCFRCAHWNEEATEIIGCPVWDAHIVGGQSEMRKPDSLLHLLIPREGGRNLECTMFLHVSELKSTENHDEKTPPSTPNPDGSDRRVELDL